MIPNIITVGNAVCGFVALTLIAGSLEEVGGSKVAHLEKAAWFILLGMVFDVFDGRVARMTGSSSGLGGQLDSLADLVTFGLAPAGLVVTLHRTILEETPWGKIVWVLGLAYFLGAMLRLARFNVEQDNGEEDHLCFRGMPTPGAAGVVASLVLVYFWLDKWKSWELRSMSATAPDWVGLVSTWIPRGMPLIAFLLGYAMVTNRLRYPHVASHLFAGKQSFDRFVYLIFGGILVTFLVEPILCALFIGYMLWTPLRALIGRLPRSREAEA